VCTLIWTYYWISHRNFECVDEFNLELRTVDKNTSKKSPSRGKPQSSRVEGAKDEGVPSCKRIAEFEDASNNTNMQSRAPASRHSVTLGSPDCSRPCTSNICFAETNDLHDDLHDDKIQALKYRVEALERALPAVHRTSSYHSSSSQDRVEALERTPSGIRRLSSSASTTYNTAFRTPSDPEAPSLTTSPKTPSLTPSPRSPAFGRVPSNSIPSFHRSESNLKLYSSSTTYNTNFRTSSDPEARSPPSPAFSRVPSNSFHRSHRSESNPKLTLDVQTTAGSREQVEKGRMGTSSRAVSPTTPTRISPGNQAEKARMGTSSRAVSPTTPTRISSGNRFYAEVVTKRKEEEEKQCRKRVQEHTRKDRSPSWGSEEVRAEVIRTQAFVGGLPIHSSGRSQCVQRRGSYWGPASLEVPEKRLSRPSSLPSMQGTPEVSFEMQTVPEEIDQQAREAAGYRGRRSSSEGDLTLELGKLLRETEKDRDRKRETLLILELEKTRASIKSQLQRRSKQHCHQRYQSVDKISI
jgi:hypothetical protein